MVSTLEQQTQQQKEEEYWQRFLLLAKNSKVSDLENLSNVSPKSLSPGSTRVWYQGEAKKWDPASLLQEHARMKGDVCIVENITPDWIKALGSAWDVSPYFFLSFVASGDTEGRWAHDSKGPFRYHELKGAVSSAQDKFDHNFYTIRGEFLGSVEMQQEAWTNRHRSIAQSRATNDGYYTKIRTCISLCKTKNGLVLILVDPPVVSTPNSWRIKLRTIQTVDFQGHGAAHFLCGPLDPSNGPGQLFNSCLGDPICRIIFDSCVHFDYDQSVQWVVLMLANFSCEQVLRAIKSELYDISFRQVQRPSMSISDRLHRKREELWRLKSALAETKTSLPELGDNLHFAREKKQLLLQLDDMLAESTRQEDMLIQTFQILHSTITIQESQLSIQQSKRAALLTWLAFIYAPLAFVSSIFGMNVAEINGSPLSVWTVVIALVVVILITLGMFAAYRSWDKWKSQSSLIADKDPSKLV